MTRFSRIVTAGDWLQSIDAVMNFSMRQIVLGAASGEIAPATAGRMADRLIRDAGIEPMLRSWMVIDNHDIPRIATQLPELSRRRWVQTLQFTLPGAPNIYYGSESCSPTRRPWPSPSE